MDTPPDFLLDLESRLHDDPDGSHRTALLTRLAELEHDLRRRIKAGLPPAEYRSSEAVAAALAAASTVVNDVSV